jgi:hypothetical protein
MERLGDKSLQRKEDRLGFKNAMLVKALGLFVQPLGWSPG